MPPPRRRSSPAKVAAAHHPVARVAVDVSLAHLDRPFDYLLTEQQSAAARPGCRVRVRFSGQLVDGFVLERVEASDHEGRLAFVERVVSGEPVLAPEIVSLARAVADRWAGTFADVVRLAVPPRHAATESEASAPTEPVTGTGVVATLARYDGGAAMTEALAAGDTPRVSWQLLPGAWPQELGALVAATLSAGRGVVVVVPDHRDVARVDRALSEALGPGRHLTLTADAGPAARYRSFLAVRRGQVRCVVGTRAAVWAPVEDLGLVVVLDDGDDLLAEPRAPYCHARDVAVLRAHLAGAGVVLAGHAVSADAAFLVSTGWLRPLDPTAAARSSSLPAVRATGDDDALERDAAARSARLPTVAWQAARDALAAGSPVLVQVPRSGYQPSLVCEGCRLPAGCPICAGPLARSRHGGGPACRWCGAAAAGWRCPHCSDERLRAVVVGATRTAEDLGRAFPGVTVRTSGSGHVLAGVADRPALVVATPGAEPVAAGGYGAVLLLDSWALLSRSDLRASEEALRRWLTAAALVRPESDGGRVVVVAPGELRPVQALIRWQPRWHADRELADRTELRLPPAARMAALTGPADALHELAASLALPPGADTLGPVAVASRPGEPGLERVLIRVPRRDGARLAATLKQGAAVRSARKARDPVRIELDPQVIG